MKAEPGDSPKNAPILSSRGKITDKTPNQRTLGIYALWDQI